MSHIFALSKAADGCGRVVRLIAASSTTCSTAVRLGDLLGQVAVPIYVCKNATSCWRL